MHRRNPHHRLQRHEQPAPEPHLRIGHPFARFALGVTVAIAVVGAGAFVFGPFSDLSDQQLAAGPNAAGPDKAPAPIIYARTGRAWRSEAQQRVTAAASAPIARVARGRLDQDERR
jgi:hypothetical protein